MKDFRHIIKVNKLVVLAGLFFMFNSQISAQDSIPKSFYPYHKFNFQEKDYSYIPDYYQKISKNGNYIWVENYLGNGHTKKYNLRFEKKIFRKPIVYVDSSISYYTNKIIRDSLGRITKVIAIQDSIKYTDSTVYDSIGRVIYHCNKKNDFRILLLLIDTIGYKRNTINEYKLLNYKENFYSLIGSDGTKLVLNNNNYIIKRQNNTNFYNPIYDSIFYEFVKDTLFYSGYQKDHLDSNGYYLKYDVTLVGDKILSERHYHRNKYTNVVSLYNLNQNFYDSHGKLIFNKNGLYDYFITLNIYDDFSGELSKTILTNTSNLQGKGYSFTNSFYYFTQENSRSLNEIIMNRLFENMSLKKQRRFYIRKRKGKENYVLRGY